MYSRGTTTLQEAVIEALAARIHIPAAEIQRALAARYRKVSIQAIYKELRKLQLRGVAIKAGKVYSLTLSWVLRTVEFSDLLEANYLRGGHAIVPVPAPGRSLRWRFSDLRRVDDFWVQAMLSLTTQAATERIYQWVPQPWYHLAHHEKELLFQRSAKSRGIRVFMIMGGRNFLARSFSKYWAPEVYTYATARSPFDHLRSIYLNVIGDYVMRITLDRNTTETIERIFGSVESRRDLRPSTIGDLFGRKAGVVIRLYHHATMARRLRRRFERYFKESLSPQEWRALNGPGTDRK